MYITAGNLPGTFRNDHTAMACDIHGCIQLQLLLEARNNIINTAERDQAFMNIITILVPFVFMQLIAERSRMLVCDLIICTLSMYTTILPNIQSCCCRPDWGVS